MQKDRSKERVGTGSNEYRKWKFRHPGLTVSVFFFTLHTPVCLPNHLSTLS